jgi:hypothetical protein
MRQGVRVHAEVISVDIGAWFAIASCSFSAANRILGNGSRYILKKGRRLKSICDSQTHGHGLAGPQKLAVLV